MVVIALRIKEDFHNKLRELLEKENKEREQKGYKKMSMNAFLNSLLMEAVAMRESNLKKNEKVKMEEAEKKAIEFVNTMKELQILSLLGYDGVKFERM